MSIGPLPSLGNKRGHAEVVDKEKNYEPESTSQKVQRRLGSRLTPSVGRPRVSLPWGKMRSSAPANWWARRHR
jgi:hypothetical protein